MIRIKKISAKGLPIKYWSHSSLMSYLRNPLAWYKRYVEKVYDQPSSPAGIVGRAGHVALQHFYGGIEKEGAIELGLEYLRDVPDFEINFGKAKSRQAKKQMRLKMERQYKQAIGFYLAKPPKHTVVGIEVSNMAKVQGLPLPIKAISDLVVESRSHKGALDIVDHKFVDSFSAHKQHKTLFVIQALFNYYTVTQKYKQPVKRFIVYECKKTENADEGFVSSVVFESGYIPSISPFSQTQPINIERIFPLEHVRRVRKKYFSLCEILGRIVKKAVEYF